MFEDCLFWESAWYELLVEQGSSVCGVGMSGEAASICTNSNAVVKTHVHCEFQVTIGWKL